MLSCDIVERSATVQSYYKEAPRAIPRHGCEASAESLIMVDVSRAATKPTKTAGNCLLRLLDHDPGPILYGQPQMQVLLYSVACWHRDRHQCLRGSSMAVMSRCAMAPYGEGIPGVFGRLKQIPGPWVARSKGCARQSPHDIGHLYVLDR